MKNRREFLGVLMLLSLLLFFSRVASAQSAKDLKRDLSVKFDARPEDGRDFEVIVGDVENKSANLYPCVLLTFSTATTSGSPLGVVSVEVLSILPHGMQHYEKRLPSGIGEVGFKSISECTPPVSNFCTISGHILEDKNKYTTTVDLYAPADTRKRLLFAPVGDDGQYKFPRVPVGEYVVKPNGNYPSSNLDIAPDPRSRRVTCQPNGSPSADFTIKSNEG